MLRRFHLDEPETVQDASDLLSRYGESARVYAGGTELLLAMKEGLFQSERLGNVKKIQLVADDELTLKTGKAELIMKKNGDILIKGKKITEKGSGDVIIKGSKIKGN